MTRGCISLNHLRMSPRRHSRSSTLFTRLVHGLLLLAWLVSSQGLAPAAVLATAVMDGAHIVSVGVSAEGNHTVILAHGDRAAHQHAPLCAFIISFAETAPENGADHVFSFRTVEDAARRIWQVAALIRLTAPSVLVKVTPPVRSTQVLIAHRHPAPAWSPGLELKAAKTILLC